MNVKAALIAMGVDFATKMQKKNIAAFASSAAFFSDTFIYTPSSFGYIFTAIYHSYQRGSGVCYYSGYTVFCP